MIASMKACPVLVANLALLVAAAAGPTVFAQSGSAAKPAPPVAVTVPFVGCASDGQVGPLKAPTRQEPGGRDSCGNGTKARLLQSGIQSRRSCAARLELFFHVWLERCEHFCEPRSYQPESLLLGGLEGFTREVIQLSYDSGGTSGRFEVANVIAHVFPAYKAFAQKVIAEGMEPASDFPFGPYPSDKLTYRGKNIVEFETPANAHGMGTDSLLLMNASPIDGVAIISGVDTDLTQLSARVPATDSDLIPAMVETDREGSRRRLFSMRRAGICSRSRMVWCERDARMTLWMLIVRSQEQEETA